MNYEFVCAIDEHTNGMMCAHQVNWQVSIFNVAANQNTGKKGLNARLPYPKLSTSGVSFWKAHLIKEEFFLHFY